MSKRSSLIRPTAESNVLKALRIKKNLSMKKAGELVGVSDSTIAHVETGRMNAPEGSRLNAWLSVYGISLRQFKNMASKFQNEESDRDKLLELVMRANDKQVDTISKVVRGLMS